MIRYFSLAVSKMSGAYIAAGGYNQVCTATVVEVVSILVEVRTGYTGLAPNLDSIGCTIDTLAARTAVDEEIIITSIL